MSKDSKQEDNFMDTANSVKGTDTANINWADILSEILESVKQKKSLVLYGPPGTGKTRIVYELLEKLKQEKLLGKFESVQFHHKFGYEDFIEGYVPNAKGGFEKRNGIFKKFISNPSDENKLDVFFIDEINRADLTTTFGELLFLMDDRDERKVRTSHFDDEISLPTNTVIIGTMNTADRNIAVVDFALRRRFRFIPLFTDYNVLLEVVSSRDFKDGDIEPEDYVRTAKVINQRIGENRLMGRHMELGHAMWFPGGTGSISDQDLLDLFRFTILPQLEAYCGYGYEHQMKTILNENVASLYLTSKQVEFDDIKGLIKDIANKAS